MVALVNSAQEHFDAFLKPLGMLQAECEGREAELSTITDMRMRFDDLELSTVLGVGSFGYVRLAVHKPTQQAPPPQPLPDVRDWHKSRDHPLSVLPLSPCFTRRASILGAISAQSHK